MDKKSESGYEYLIKIRDELKSDPKSECFKESAR